jgi:hypothetical protein
MVPEVGGVGFAPIFWDARTLGRGSKPARAKDGAKPHRGRAEFFALPDRPSRFLPRGTFGMHSGRCGYVSE